MNEFKEGRTVKWLTAEQLREAIVDIPGDAKVWPNSVGNMTVVSAADEYLGYIDFLHDGEYVRV